MKAIQLTEEHKSKLLEMCEKLCKDKDHTWFKISMYNEILWVNKKAKIGSIYWFEFCMTYLCDKIFLPRGESRLDGIKGMDYYRINKNMHPVDYLYSEFKKLNTPTLTVKPVYSEETFSKIKEIAGALVGDLLEATLLAGKKHSYELTSLDMGLDYLDEVEFLMYVERDFNISIDDEEFVNFINTKPTLGDRCVFIESKLKT